MPKCPRSKPLIRQSVTKFLNGYILLSILYNSCVSVPLIQQFSKYVLGIINNLQVTEGKREDYRFYVDTTPFHTQNLSI